ncbi:MAG TPA: imidazoleglycerol-phosphate dehydratase HisB [Candidatus Faecousia faecavium]|nr:imidazoleglycerol-phosphate dehydratase HisB [Candidatus Faecousia faecavium]
MRSFDLTRKTAETDIRLSLNLDGSGRSNIATGCGFLDHMLTLFAAHGKFDLEVTCNGDTQVDDHHSVEDIGICLGTAFQNALGEKRGIARYGSFLLPMDEALILCAVDLSGRSCLCYDLNIPTEKIGTFDTELIEEFLLGLVRNCPMSLHLKQLAGKNAHHIAEGAFKALARALKAAVAQDGSGEIPSTKGVL